MMPTNAISPDTATAAAVPSEAATISRYRVRCGCAPREAASSSPTASTSSWRPLAMITAVLTAAEGDRRSTSCPPAGAGGPERPEDTPPDLVAAGLLGEGVPARGEAG